VCWKNLTEARSGEFFEKNPGPHQLGPHCRDWIRSSSATPGHRDKDKRSENVRCGPRGSLQSTQSWWCREEGIEARLSTKNRMRSVLRRKGSFQTVRRAQKKRLCAILASITRRERGADAGNSTRGVLQLAEVRRPSHEVALLYALYARTPRKPSLAGGLRPLRLA